jgi:transposase
MICTLIGELMGERTMASEVSILPGPERRRKWTVAEKLSIVEESCLSGARVTDVARRRGLHPNQVHQWRRQARMGELVRSAGSSGFLSVAVTPEDTTSAAAAVTPEGQAGLIEIQFGGDICVRMPATTPTDLASAVIGALRAR